MAAAPFDDLQESDDIAVHVGMRVFDGIAHAGLRAQVHHALKFPAVKNGLHRLAIRQIRLDELEAS